MKTLPVKNHNILIIALVLSFSLWGAAKLVTPINASGDAIAGNTIYVATSGVDSNSCGSQSSPCKNIQYAVNKSETGDTILVAAGTYTYSDAADYCQTWYGTTGVICIESNKVQNLIILGGYKTSNWLQADPVNNKTIIDAGGSKRGVFVLQTSVGPINLHMEGFTIRNGLARGISARNGNDAIHSFGGGMFADGADTTHKMYITLKHMVFENNLSQAENTSSGAGGTATGGGIALRSADDTILENVIFRNNEAHGGIGPEKGGYGIGGGLYLHERSTVIASNLTFINNKVIGGSSSGSGRVGSSKADAQGGGLTVHSGSTMTLQGGSFTGNIATGGNAPNGDGGGAFGGGAKVEGEPWANKTSTLNLLDVTFTGNKAVGGNGVNGGIVGGGALESIHSNVNMASLVVVNNQAQGGNGTSNQGPAGGGGGYFQNLRETPSNINIVNSIFADNTANTGAGSIKGGGGGGIWLQGVDANIIHTTIARNSLGQSYMQGNGVLVMNDGATHSSDADILYSIIAEHTQYPNQAALHVKPGNTATLYRGLFAGNAANSGGGGAINGLSSMINGTAAFVSPGAPNFDYHIKRNSSAINQAVGSTVPIDIDGDSRQESTPPDIGADEYIPISLTVIPVSDGTLALYWKVNPATAAEVSQYHIIYSSENGANYPSQGASPIRVGSATSFTLTGLTNYRAYTLYVEAYNTANSLLEVSNSVVAIPTDKFVYLPTITK